jgi:hypothetical protein
VVLSVVAVLVVTLIVRAYGRGGADGALSATVNVCIGALILFALINAEPAERVRHEQGHGPGTDGE